MFRSDLIKNKLCAIGCIIFGLISVPVCDGDATFGLFMWLIGICLFFTKDNLFAEYEDVEDDGYVGNNRKNFKR